MTDLLLKQEVFAIIGAAVEVHRFFGSGFLEGVYQEALELELEDRGIPFAAQMPVSIKYKKHLLKREYQPDLVCYGKIVTELKAIDSLSGREASQLLNYLKATNLRVGLLVNFGSESRLEWKRFVR
jgi:GxxExxY protein